MERVPKKSIGFWSFAKLLSSPPPPQSLFFFDKICLPPFCLEIRSPSVRKKLHVVPSKKKLFSAFWQKTKILTIFLAPFSDLNCPLPK